MNLTKLKEDIVTKYILKLINYRFSPRLVNIANIANSLRAKYNLG
jgi:hypothetical protein